MNGKTLHRRCRTTSTTTWWDKQKYKNTDDRYLEETVRRPLFHTGFLSNFIHDALSTNTAAVRVRFIASQSIRKHTVTVSSNATETPWGGCDKREDRGEGDPLRPACSVRKETRRGRRNAMTVGCYFSLYVVVEEIEPRAAPLPHTLDRACGEVILHRRRLKATYLHLHLQKKGKTT